MPHKINLKILLFKLISGFYFLFLFLFCFLFFKFKDRVSRLSLSLDQGGLQPTAIPLPRAPFPFWVGWAGLGWREEPAKDPSTLQF